VSHDHYVHSNLEKL